MPGHRDPPSAGTSRASRHDDALERRPTGTPAPASTQADGFDLLVIGGGINGAGIARDAAMRGLRVLLVEKEDWGSGTSAKSSMLAHGGLRYLEQFELGLVHEALQERERMFRQAPHLVRPLEFVYPLYPHVASRRTVRAGLWLYDVLSHGKSVPRRRYLQKQDVLDRLPGLRPEGLQGGATYHDGQWQSVERFVHELVADARKHGAVCLNHVRAELVVRGRRCVGARLVPEVPEARVALQEIGEPPWSVRAAATINAAGPWVDRVLDPALPDHATLIRGTKGIHIVVPRFVDTALIVRAKDGRTFFILPWQEHCVIGTTDTDYRGDPGAARANAEEVTYLQESARWYFPDAPVDQIRWTYAGVRPLVRQEGLTESHVTRRHRLHDHAAEGAAGLWSVQGGKLTTYRHLAEEAVDEAGRLHGWPRHHPTLDAPLPGAPETAWEAFCAQAVAEAVGAGIDQVAAAHLVDTYGRMWRHVLEAGGEDGARRVAPDRPELWCAIDHAVAHEQAVTLADVMLRRTQLGLHHDGRIDVAKRVARRMARLLGWGAGRVRHEVQRYRDAVAVLGIP